MSVRLPKYRVHPDYGWNFYHCAKFHIYAPFKMWPKIKRFGFRYYWDGDYRDKMRSKIDSEEKRARYGAVSKGRRNAIFAQLVLRDGYGCKKCGSRKSGDVMTIDHIVPISKGGTSLLSNMQILCRKCHDLKDNPPKKVIPNVPIANVRAGC